MICYEQNINFKNIMLKTYLIHLQSRIQAIQKLLGPVNEYSQSQIKQIRDGLNDFTSKLQKDIVQKFKRIKKDIEKYHAVIDVVPKSDKITLVHSEIEELNSLSTQLASIEKLLPTLNTQNYLKFREEYKNLHLFTTASVLEESISEKVAVKQENLISLADERTNHRNSMNQILELNGLIMKNLSIKMQALQNKRSQETIS